jgi:hypothetical protein
MESNPIVDQYRGLGHELTNRNQVGIRQIGHFSLARALFF